MRRLRLLADQRDEVGEGVVAVLVRRLVLGQRRRAVRPAAVHGGGGGRDSSGGGGGADDRAVVGGGVGQGRVLVRQTCAGSAEELAHHNERECKNDAHELLERTN